MSTEQQNQAACQVFPTPRIIKSHIRHSVRHVDAKGCWRFSNGYAIQAKARPGKGWTHNCDGLAEVSVRPIGAQLNERAPNKFTNRNNFGHPAVGKLSRHEGMHCFHAPPPCPLTTNREKSRSHARFQCLRGKRFALAWVHPVKSTPTIKTT